MSITGNDDLTIRANVEDDASADLARIRGEVDATGRSAERAGKRANIGARGFDKMAAGAGRLGKVAGKGLAYGLAGVGITLGVVTGAAAYFGVKTAASMETAKIGFTTMLGSAKKANTFLKQLANFAAKTPFEFPELQTAASSLISAGIDAKKVIPIMTTLGNVTSGMGTGAEGVQRATIALQQMSAAGKISGEDLNQLRDAGIPVYDLLAKATGKSKAEVVKLAQAGKLGAKELGQMMHALETGKGLERFDGLMEKQSASLAGVWSTLSDTVNMGLAKAFKPAIPLLKKLTLSASDFAQKGAPMLATGIATAIRLGKRLKGAFDRRGLDGVATVIHDKFGVKSSKILHTVEGIVDDLSTVFTDSLIPAIQDAGNMLPVFLTPLGLARELLGFMADHTTLTKDALEGLVIVLTLAKAAQMAKNAVDAIQLAKLMLLTPGTALYAIKTGLVATATGLATGAQWLWNAALDANPIGLIIVAIGLLVAAFVILWKHSETFRKIVKASLHAVGDAGTWLWEKVLRPVFQWIVKGIAWVIDAFASLLGALGHVPGFGWAKDAADKMHHAADETRQWADSLSKLPSKKTINIVTVETTIKHNAGRVGDPVGDTASSRARGRGNIASTLAFHNYATHATGARPTITNAFAGGGGRGRGSGDHQAGRALDLTGPGLASYARLTRDAGGYAAMHGAGPSRHLHAVPPAMGDTHGSRAPGGHGGVTVAPGAVVIHVGTEVTAESARKVKAAVKAALAEIQRDAEERG